MAKQGKFKIESWQEEVTQELAADAKVSVAKVKQSYSGFFEGSSELQYQLAYNSSGEASFVGFEVIQAKVEQQQLTIVLQHNGLFKNGVATSEFEIIDCQPKHSLKGSKGAFESTSGGEANYQIS